MVAVGGFLVQKKLRARAVLTAVFVGVCALFFSCSSIPNEDNVRRENEAIEYAKLADGYYEQKNYTKAAEYYQKALTGEKYRDVVTYKLACSYALSSQWAKARAQFESLLTKDPQNRTLRESIAYVTVMSGDIASGGALYEALANEYPEDATLLKNYMLVLIASGNKKDAETRLTDYVARFGDDENAELIENRLTGKTATADTDKRESAAVTPLGTGGQQADNAATDSEKKETGENKNTKVDTKEEEFEIPDWTL